MYQELLSKEPIASFEEMEEKVAKWIEWYNFKRPHQGIDGLVPADRFFSVEGGVREMMEKGASIVKDALIVDPRKIKKPMYLIGRIGGKEIRVIAKEGSVMVEGLDGFEEKKMEEKNDGGNEYTAGTTGAEGAEQILPGNTAGGEVPVCADGDGEKEAGKADMRGTEDNQGNIQGMEENGNRGHGEGLSGPWEEGSEAQGISGDGGGCAGEPGRGKETGEKASDADIVA